MEAINYLVNLQNDIRNFYRSNRTFGSNRKKELNGESVMYYQINALMSILSAIDKGHASVKDVMDAMLLHADSTKLFTLRETPRDSILRKLLSKQIISELCPGYFDVIRILSKNPYIVINIR